MAIDSTLLDFWVWLTESFNNREISGAAWLSLGILFSLKNDGVRKGLQNVLLAAVDSKILTVFSIYGAYLLLLVLIGNNYGFWSHDQTAQTIIWFLFGGIPLLVRSVNPKDGVRHFRGYALSVLSITTVLEFIFVAKTFSLFIEIILVPIVTFVALLAAFSEHDKKYASVNKLMTWFMAIFAVIILWNSVAQIWASPEQFFTTDVFLTFVLPIYLALGSIPIFYFLYCFAQFEGASISIEHTSCQPEDIKAYAKKWFSNTFYLRPWLLRRAVRQFHNLPAKSTEDVDAIIDEVMHHEYYSAHPPIVRSFDGWSPFAAQDLLADQGLMTEDYHSNAGDDWWCGVVSCNLDEGLLPSTANFSFSGRRGVVTEIKLRGYFNGAYVTDDALKEFSRLAQLLADRAIEEQKSRDQLVELVSLDPFITKIGSTTIKLVREQFPSGNGFELVLYLSRGR
jgi:hypothetical protein